MRAKMGIGFVVIAILGIVLGGFAGCSGCIANPETPAGYAGYVTRDAVVGKTQFVGIQYGPTSTGLGWMLRAQNVSITPYTYSEEFSGNDAVLSRDNLKIGFRVDVIWKVRKTDEAIRTFFEGYSILEQGKSPDKVAEIAYASFVNKPLRSFALTEVQQREGLKVKEELAVIGLAIKRQIDVIVAETPFEVMSVVIGNVQYPSEVADAVALKLAATQRLEQQDTELSIKKKQAEQRIADANGVAEAMRIINNQLTASYLQHEAIEAQKAMVGSPNHTTIYIPTGANGVPLVGTLDMSPRRRPSASSPVVERAQ